MTEIVIPPRAQSRKSPHVKRAGLSAGKGQLSGVWRMVRGAAPRVILLLLLLSCFLSAGRVAKTYFIVYPVSPSLIVSSEAERWELSSVPMVRLVRFINQSVPDDAAVMVFRQSDIAYYTDNPIATFTADQHAELFSIKTPTALHAALLARNIQYVAVPSYGMAEINRSAFKPLLNEGHFAALAFEADGEKLFRIYDRRRDLQQRDSASIGSTIEAQTFVRVRDLDLKNTDQISDWTAFQKPTSLAEALRFGQPQLTLPMSNAGPTAIRIDRDRPFVARPSLVDVLQAWPLQSQYSPLVRGETEFPVENGIYRISGAVAAKGKVDLSLRITVMGADQQAGTYEWPLWSEVLNGESSRVQATTAISIPALEQLRNSPGASVSAMLFFTLEQGGYLEVSTLSVDRLETPDDKDGFFTMLRRRTAATSGGWSLDDPGFGGLYARPLDLLSRSEAGGVRFKQISGAAETLLSPPYVAADSQIDALDALSLERRALQSSPRIALRFATSGQGAMSVRVFGYCTDGTPFSDNLRTYSLDREGKSYAPSGALSCVPNLVRAAFKLDRDKFLYPPNFERGEAVLADLSMTLTLWDNDGQQRALVLRAAPELSSHPEGATPLPTAGQDLPDFILPDFDR